MRVQVLYFAAVRELIGTAEEWLVIPTRVITVADFGAWLPEARPALRGALGAVRIARNERFAEPDEILAEGDVLALLPPVAGG